MSAFNPAKNSKLITRIVFTGALSLIGTYAGLKYSAKHHPHLAHKHIWSKLVQWAYSNPNGEYLQMMARHVLYHDLFPKVEVDTQDVDLSVKYGEYTFENPLGNAAGVDKHGMMVDGLAKLGFGFVEVGELAPEFEPYQEKPDYAKTSMRLYPEEKSVLWKDVYTNSGIQNAILYLVKRQRNVLLDPKSLSQSKITGFNICPSRSTIDSVPYLLKMDFENCVDQIVDFTDYVVINICEKDKSKRMAISNLRTKEELTKLIRIVKEKITINLGKVAALEYSTLEKEQSEKESIVDLPKEIQKVMCRNSLISKNNVPMIFLKIDSYLTEQEYQNIAEIALQEQIDGIVVGSTVPINVGIKNKEKRKLPHDAALGGSGGDPTRELSEYALKAVYKHTKGKLLLISNGGIFTGKDMYDRIANGADLVQVYSALALKGPYIAKVILEEFSSLCKQNNETPRSLVGKNLKM